MTILLALASAALFGVGVALQQRPASAVPQAYAARLGLLTRLARRPAWLLGVLAEVAGFGVQVVALHAGSLVVVQPVITTSLVFTVALAALWSDRRVSRWEWAGVVAVVAGLAIFLVAGAPDEAGTAHASVQDWLVTAGSLGAAVGLLATAGLRSGGNARAALFATAAGLGDASMAVLTKAFSHEAGLGLAHLLVSWTPYTLIAVGVAAMVLTQTAYQVGRPTVSLPIITVADPVVSSLVGIGMFGEVVHLGGARGPSAALGVVVMLAGLGFLSRSPHVVDPAPPAALASRP